MDNYERTLQAYAKYKQKKKKIIEKDLLPPGTIKGKLYFPLTQCLLHLTNLFEQASIVYLQDKTIKTPSKRPIIFANTHKFKPDLEKITLSTKQPSFVVASDYINSYKTISGWYFNTRPTIFVDPYDKIDKHFTYQMMLKYLHYGYSCMIFPEAVWNLSENRIILNCFLGTVKAALESDAIIICTAIERYNKTYIINRRGYLDLSKYVHQKYGASYYNLSKEKQETILLECNQILRDELATRMMEIWLNDAKENGITKRDSLPNNYWDVFLKEITSEWPGYKMSDNVEQQFYTKDEINHFNLQYSYAMINPNHNNAFLFNKRWSGGL